MAITAREIAAGPGWRVSDIVCTAGPHDRPYEERHATACVAAVTRGSFQYRTRHGSAVLAPGALLLGNPGETFECGHEHAGGDRCLAFHFTAEHLEAVLAGTPGARRAVFAAPRLAPLAALVPLLAVAEAAAETKDAATIEEIAYRLPAAVLTALAGAMPSGRAPTARDEARITAALRRIEEDAAEKLSVAELASAAAMSPYHFLRTFRQVVGMTPHQFVLRTRLHRAARRLRRSAAPITEIALEAGFNDLSTFNRRFRRLIGAAPSAYRAGR